MKFFGNNKDDKDKDAEGQNENKNGESDSPKSNYLNAVVVRISIFFAVMWMLYSGYIGWLNAQKSPLSNESVTAQESVVSVYDLYRKAYGGDSFWIPHAEDEDKFIERVEQLNKVKELDVSLYYDLLAEDEKVYTSLEDEYSQRLDAIIELRALAGEDDDVSFLRSNSIEVTYRHESFVRVQSILVVALSDVRDRLSILRNTSAGLVPLVQDDAPFISDGVQ